MIKLLKNEDGVGAIEFALIMPILLIVCLGVISVWSAIAQSGEMQDSVEAAVTYMLQGGDSDETALAIADKSWRNRPKDGKVTLTKSCSCSGIDASCELPCSKTGLTPHVQITIQASSTWTSPVPVLQGLYSRTLVQRQVARVR